MNKIQISKNELKQIITEAIRDVILESTELDSIQYNGHVLNIMKYDMSNEEDKAHIRNNKDVIWSILQSGYEKLGGFKGFASRTDMIKKSPFFTLGYCDGELVTVTVYNGYIGGNKCVGATCVKDGRHDAAVKLLEMIIHYNIVNWNQWVWIEASGKIEDMCKRLGGFNVPSRFATLYIETMHIDAVDDYHYKRKIGDKIETKTIFGFKNSDIFEFLKNTLNNDVKRFVDSTGTTITESQTEQERLWQKFNMMRSEIKRQASIIGFFVTMKDDELVNEYPQEALDKLKSAMKYIKNAINTNNLEDMDLRTAKNYYSEGLRVLRTSTVLEPLKVGAA